MYSAPGSSAWPNYRMGHPHGWLSGYRCYYFRCGFIESPGSRGGLPGFRYFRLSRFHGYLSQCVKVGNTPTRPAHFF